MPAMSDANSNSDNTQALLDRVRSGGQLLTNVAPLPLADQLADAEAEIATLSAAFQDASVAALRLQKQLDEANGRAAALAGQVDQLRLALLADATAGTGSSHGALLGGSTGDSTGSALADAFEAAFGAGDGRRSAVGRACSTVFGHGALAVGAAVVLRLLHHTVGGGAAASAGSGQGVAASVAATGGYLSPLAHPPHLLLAVSSLCCAAVLAGRCWTAARHDAAAAGQDRRQAASRTGQKHSAGSLRPRVTVLVLFRIFGTILAMLTTLACMAAGHGQLARPGLPAFMDGTGKNTSISIEMAGWAWLRAIATQLWTFGTAKPLVAVGILHAHAAATLLTSMATGAWRGAGHGHGAALAADVLGEALGLAAPTAHSPHVGDGEALDVLARQPLGGRLVHSLATALSIISAMATLLGFQRPLTGTAGPAAGRVTSHAVHHQPGLPGPVLFTLVAYWILQLITKILQAMLAWLLYARQKRRVLTVLALTSRHGHASGPGKVEGKDMTTEVGQGSPGLPGDRAAVVLQALSAAQRQVVGRLTSLLCAPVVAAAIVATLGAGSEDGLGLAYVRLGHLTAAQGLLAIFVAGLVARA